MVNIIVVRYKMIILQLIAILQIIIIVNSYNSNTVKVIDRFVKNGYTDIAKQYCPPIGVCPEGTHVMCMYYDAENKHGPLCHDEQNVTMMPEFAERILDIINVIRSRTAKGVLHDKDGKKLPRGYGIYKMQWDEELATFAQLWANQCIISKDRCHASKQFPDPGQIGGVYRFTHDDKWDVISTKKINIKFTESGFTQGRVLYAIYYILRTQFSSMLKVITPEIIANITDHHIINNNAYLQLFFGNIRFVGCGVSAFKEYVYTPHKKSIYNSVFLVCNYSQRLHLYDRLYLTEKPIEEGFSEVSGCPPGFTEDSDLLCYETVCGQYCKYVPDIVVLPIFDIEDRPYRENPKYRHHGNISNVLSLGIIPSPGVAKEGPHLEDIMITKDEDFLKSKILNNADENETDNPIPVRRNQPLSRIQETHKQNARFINEDRKNYRDKSRDGALALVNKLQNVIENIGIQNKRQVIRDKVENIYRKLTTNINEPVHGNRMYKYTNYKITQTSVGNNYRRNANNNRNKALQNRHFNNNRSPIQNKQYASFNNEMLNYSAKNNMDAYGRPLDAGIYSPNHFQHLAMNTYNYNNFQKFSTNRIIDNKVNAYNYYNTAPQMRPVNYNRNYNKNTQQFATNNNVVRNNRNILNNAQTSPLYGTGICHQNIGIVRNTHDIRNQPIYPDPITNSENDRLNYNRQESYGIDEPRRYFENNDEIIPEVDKLLSYNNREQYRSTL